MVETWSFSAELFLCPPPHSCMKRMVASIPFIIFYKRYFHFLAQTMASEVLAPLLGRFCIVHDWCKCLCGFLMRPLPRGPPILPFLEQEMFLRSVSYHTSQLLQLMDPSYWLFLFFRLFQLRIEYQSPHTRKCRPGFPKEYVTNQILFWISVQGGYGKGMGDVWMGQNFSIPVSSPGKPVLYRWFL